MTLNEQVEAVAKTIRARHGMKKYPQPEHRTEDCVDCNKLGYVARNGGYQSVHLASDVCPTCNGKGFVRIVIKEGK